jgi:hypothetical protein
VSVQGIAAGRGQLAGVEQSRDLVAGPGELRAIFVENLRDGAPAGPAAEDDLLFRGGWAGIVFQGSQDRQRG